MDRIGLRAAREELKRACWSLWCLRGCFTFLIERIRLKQRCNPIPMRRRQILLINKRDAPSVRRRGVFMGEVLRVLLRWTAAWTLIGVIGGVAMMFVKVPPIAESGAKPSDLWFYAFWIPVLGVAAGVFGFALGLLFSILMELLKNWRSRAEARADVLGKYGPRILCGTLAGALIGLIFIGEGY